MVAQRLRGIGVCVVLALCFPVAGWAANCTKHGSLSATDGDAAVIRFGRINVMSAYLQPPGTLIATVVVPPTNYRKLNANDVLWTCDKADVDAGKVYFLASTNGDEKVGGYWRWDGAGGFGGTEPGIYATYFSGVGLKLTMKDKVLSRRWQKIESENLKSIPPNTNNKVQIRLRDVPNLIAELYKINGTVPNGTPQQWCPTLATPTSAGTPYNCNQPNAYIQLVGPGLPSDREGEDHGAGYYDVWWNNTGFAYTLRDNNNLLSNNASCVVRHNTPVVTFLALSVQQLMHGAQATQNFSVQIECANNVPSGVSSGQTAIGFEVSPGANHGAIVLLSDQNLTTPQGGVTHLVDDCYDCAGRAKGVGVTLQNKDIKPGDLVFVRYPGWTGTGTQGEDAGWYPVLKGATPVGSSESGYTHYNHTFTATFGRIKNMTVTPGSFNATTTILVKVQ